MTIRGQWWQNDERARAFADGRMADVSPGTGGWWVLSWERVDGSWRERPRLFFWTRDEAALEASRWVLRAEPVVVRL